MVKVFSFLYGPFFDELRRRTYFVIFFAGQTVMRTPFVAAFAVIFLAAVGKVTDF